LPTLATAVREILDDPALLRRGRANARRFARECFNWQVQGEVLLALYQGADAAQPGPAMPAHVASHAPAA
jgi:glycosyltransferase involved in cell wall biosynthesis